MLIRRIHLCSVLVSLAAVGALGSACGGSKAPADAPEPADEQADESLVDSSPEGPVKFDDMSAPQKMKHMKEVVAPTMAKVFQEANADEYANFNCANCHGPGAKQGDFKMPTTALPALDKEEMDEHPEVTKFMMERVVPEMAKLLGEEPYNPETQTGFGCYNCHTKKD
jgi:mono/diheme cytochrome c family protein